MNVCMFYFQDGVDSAILSRLLFCVGHVAQCQLVHCELNIVKERKKFRNFDQPASKVSGDGFGLQTQCLAVHT